ncbi:YbfB/YjiJ family MFS transporter [Neptunicella sp. SCSIO 80796]|uniref:YbfB/YjiJ family MFS transporter n=1 Tax=Neptunicella plasticusilytica TaxID=3117012 RepID=UPI003A4D924F
MVQDKTEGDDRITITELVGLTIAGLCASLIGIGLARFAYTPLLPALVEGNWFDAADAAYLGAANLAGYLVGALMAGTLVKKFPVVATLRVMMLAVAASFIACAWPASFIWFSLWRLLSGFAGGVLMVLAAPTVLAHIPTLRRGLVSGAIFSGIGIGIAISGTLMPLLLQQGITQTWLGLGMLSLLLTAIAWRGWPRVDVSVTVVDSSPVSIPLWSLRAVYIEYALCAFGLVPHMIFLVDFVARGLEQGLSIGSGYWVIVGFGAITGPLVLGYLADHFGYRAVLRLCLLVETFAIVLPVFSADKIALAVSCVLVGAFIPGSVILALGRIRELFINHPAGQKKTWGIATTGFALFQAAGAYSLSYVFDHSDGDYTLLFMLGGVALSLALIVDVGAVFTRHRRAELNG